MFFVYLTLILALVGYFKLQSKFKQLQKYEFENRTQGGVVEFSNYEASVKHNTKKNALALGITACTVVAIIAFVIICISFSLNHR